MFYYNTRDETVNMKKIEVAASENENYRVNISQSYFEDKEDPSINVRSSVKSSTSYASKIDSGQIYIASKNKTLEQSLATDVSMTKIKFVQDQLNAEYIVNIQTGG